MGSVANHVFCRRISLTSGLCLNTGHGCGRVSESPYCRDCNIRRTSCWHFFASAAMSCFGNMGAISATDGGKHRTSSIWGHDLNTRGTSLHVNRIGRVLSGDATHSISRRCACESDPSTSSSTKHDVLLSPRRSDEILRVCRYEDTNRATSSCDRIACVALISRGSIPHERIDASAIVVFPIPGGPWRRITFEYGFVVRYVCRRDLTSRCPTTSSRNWGRRTSLHIVVVSMG